MGEGEIRSEGKKPERWDYKTHFREYLLLLGAKGKDALEPMANYPARIGLSETWHATHVQMKEETLNDDKERLAIVGFKENWHLTFPVNPVVGTETHVPYKALVRELQNARERYKVVDLVGQIHSHHDNSPFSTRDLFSLLYEPFETEIARHLSQDDLPLSYYFAGLVTTEEVIYAFKTRETFPIRAFDMWPKKPSEVFTKYWYEKSGLEYHEEGGKEWVRQLRPNPNKWDANFGIAQAHNLVLYKGKPNKDLTRIYPE